MRPSRRPLAPRLRPGALVVAGALLCAVAASAGDARPVDLPLAGGATIRGTVESSDAREVVVRVGPEEVRRIPWTQLTALGFYRAKAALAPAADGAARVELAELAADLGLHAEVREEYEKAYGLGAIDRKAYEEAVTQAERRAVELGVERAKGAAESGDVEGAMETARRLKMDFANAPNAAAVDALIGDLLQKLKSLDAEAERLAAELERAQVELARNREVVRRMAHSAQTLAEGQAFAEEAAAARAKGNVTKSERNAQEADERYMACRRDLGRLRRILPKDHERRPDVLARLTELDRVQFALLLATAKFFFDQRVYSKAETWANRAAYLDPVHPDLLEIRDELRARRIKLRLSDITNARPIIR
jgi:chromosome segregation ATPase